MIDTNPTPAPADGLPEVKDTQLREALAYADEFKSESVQRTYPDLSWHLGTLAMYARLCIGTRSELTALRARVEELEGALAALRPSPDAATVKDSLTVQPPPDAGSVGEALKAFEAAAPGMGSWVQRGKTLASAYRALQQELEDARAKQGKE